MNALPAPAPAARALRLRNAAASAGVVVLACVAYAALPVHRQTLERIYGPPDFAFSGRGFLVTVAGLYIMALCVHFLRQREAVPSKSLRFFRVFWQALHSPRERWRTPLDADDRLALLSTLLKAFFGPLMTVSLMGFCMGAWLNGSALLASSGGGVGLRALFDRFGFWFLMQAILFVDVLVFTVGYLVESRRLGNEIRSVDPTWLGWAAALVCYPPFNSLTAWVLGSQHSDFPQFDDPTLHLALNLLLLALMAIYASASVALGFKGSNLTHRGIVARGPYALVRHPAYACKNMAWWIAAVPLVGAAFGRSWFDGLQALASVVAWTMLYVLRALTEEDHLRGVDRDYARYAARVRYRFVPGLV